MNKLFRYLLFVLMPVISFLTVSCEEDTEPTPEPQITQIYPAASTPGSLVAIIGLNVKGTSSVTFGDVEAAILSDTANAVLVNVPAGIGSGDVLVTVDAPGGTYTYPFKVLDPALASTFTAVSPATGGVGTEVSLTGTNLAGATALSIGNTVIEQFEVNDAGNAITFTVPRSAYFSPFSGTFAVTTPEGTFFSPINVRFDLIQTADVLVALTADDPFVLSGFEETVILTAQLTGEDEDLATVSKVVFMEGSTVLSEATIAPYVHEFTVGADVAPYTNYEITALAYDADGGLIMDTEVLKVRVGERIPISRGTLTGVGAEVWNTDGPKEPPFPADGVYAGFLNFDGAGNLDAASGANIPVTVPETGRYLAALGLASGWADAESFMWLFFNNNVNAAQRSPEVPPNGWIAFEDYHLANPFQLEAGEQVAKVRFGGPYVHPYYLDLYKF
jgi:hypothetical protein